MKRCKYCGGRLTKKGTRVCAECRAAEGDTAAKRELEADIPKKARVKRAAKLIKRSPRIWVYDEPKIDRSRCKTCLFRMKLFADDALWRCGYCYYTGKRRPCEMSPECTVYQKYDRSKRHAMSLELKNTGTTTV